MIRRRWTATALAMGLVIVGAVVGAYAMQSETRAAGPPASSYLSVNEDDFRTVLARMRPQADSGRAKASAPITAMKNDERLGRDTAGSDISRTITDCVSFARLVSRFRSSHTIAVTSDANFGIKGTLASI